ncbi:MAG: helix-turn-helix domain-containing protein [Acidimicrobiia bacterium]
MVDDMDALPVPNPKDPEAALAAVVAFRRTADRLEAAAVAAAIRQGWTWAQIAEALGVTRQAVHKKYAHRIETKESR